MAPASANPGLGKQCHPTPTLHRDWLTSYSHRMGELQVLGEILSQKIWSKATEKEP